MQTITLVATDGDLMVDSQDDIRSIDTAKPAVLRILFDSSWAKYAKVVEFTDTWGNEMTPQILKNGYSCVLPSSIFKDSRFSVRVIGLNAARETMSTGRARIYGYKEV